MGRKTVINKITSAETNALINKNNIRLKEDFLSYLKSVKRSQGTINGYDNDLMIVFTYILENLDNKDFSKLTKRDIIAMQNWFVDNGNSPARIRRLKAAMSSLSNYCENILADDDPDFEGYRSIVRKIENPALQPVREKTVWQDSELEDLLSSLVEKKKYEKACLVALAMYGGRRKAELARFKVSDFDDSRIVCDGALYKSSPILTKGGKYLECYTLANRFKPYFDLWMNERRENKIESEWLFPSSTNPKEHISIPTINSWVETFSRITGKDLYMHSLRHYAVSALIRAGIPDSVVIDMIGWSSSEMLKVYDDNPKDEKLGMYFKDGDISVPEKKGLSEL